MDETRVEQKPQVLIQVDKPRRVLEGDYLLSTTLAGVVDGKIHFTSKDIVVKAPDGTYTQITGQGMTGIQIGEECVLPISGYSMKVFAEDVKKSKCKFIIGGRSKLKV